MLRGFYGIICVIAVWLVTSSGGNTLSVLILLILCVLRVVLLLSLTAGNMPLTPTLSPRRGGEGDHKTQRCQVWVKTTPSRRKGRDER